ncbi:hypothetical protein Lesp02_01220 [Lentzea sp. NBRC 105346]|uniref:Rv1733c family protein n=1 Tax=Lentzea sp. NBRC 105346 TaxID=3032205 RepID=UPI0024A2DF5C|nr:hypothetical protein [Lentzea sp. NBRC 105346]GLZ27932.1 hypothetical protein Lesp02_01220 [Lentzea sp. NBRC 105346]
MTTTLLSRIVHTAFPGRNRLAGAGDRVEAAVLIGAVAVALLAVPIAGATGSEIYATQKVQAAGQQQTRHRAQAVLIENAPPMIGSAEKGGVVESAPVAAAWRLPDGMTREGTVQAHYGAQAGATLPIWIDDNGDIADPPLTPQGAAINAIILALLLWGGMSGTMAVLYLVVRFVHSRFRLRRWGAEWDRIAPEWTGR